MKSVTLLDLEGLILNGFIQHLEVVDCESPSNIRLSKIIGKLSDGTEVVTECYEHSRLGMIYSVFINYRNKSWFSEVKSGAVMSGITYDLE